MSNMHNINEQSATSEVDFLKKRITELEYEAENILRPRILQIEAENKRFRRCVAVETFPRILGERISGLNVLWIGPCHIEGLSIFADRVGCHSEHLLYSSFPHENITPFNSNDFDCMVVGMTLRNLLLSTGGSYAPDFQHLRPDWNEDNIDLFFNNCFSEMKRQLHNIYENCCGKPVFFVTFLEPGFKFLGNVIEDKGLEDIRFFVRALNNEMTKYVQELDNSYIIDINELSSSVGRMHLQDDIMTFYTHAGFIGDYDVHFDKVMGRSGGSASPIDVYDIENRWHMLNEVFWDRLLDNMKIIRGDDRVKLIVVDLDDTLWRGIAAEPMPDSVDNEVYVRTIGWPMAFAEALLYFKKRGGLIAICSKNDKNSTLERFKNLWGNRITIDDFCSVRINWERKSENIKSIIDEVNVLPDSVVFADDNPRELDEVSREIPGIRTLGLSHYDWRRIVLLAPEMQIQRITDESKRRTNLIRAKIAREEESSERGKSEWLSSLEIKVNFRHISSTSDVFFNRSFELLNKTNQFNTTGERHSLDEVGKIFSANGYIISMEVTDRHADNGIVGVALLQKNKILQVVLSCRVFGLGVEEAFLSNLVAKLRENSEDIFSCEKQTPKNLVSRDFFVRNGFKKIEDGNAILTKDIKIKCPEWIEIISK